jgi:hypothetical protein
LSLFRVHTSPPPPPPPPPPHTHSIIRAHTLIPCRRRPPGAPRRGLPQGHHVLPRGAGGPPASGAAGGGGGAVGHARRCTKALDASGRSALPPSAQLPPTHHDVVCCPAGLRPHRNLRCLLHRGA